MFFQTVCRNSSAKSDTAPTAETSIQFRVREFANKSAASAVFLEDVRLANAWLQQQTQKTLQSSDSDLICDVTVERHGGAPEDAASNLWLFQ